MVMDSSDGFDDDFSDFETPVQKHGRPTKYEGEKTDRIAKALCDAGKTDLEIAQILGVAESTFHLWKIKHPRFSEQVARAKEKVDDMVERTFLRAATGYEVVEKKTVTKFVKIGDNETEAEVTEVSEIVKAVNPDYRAAYTWLRHRRKDKWNIKHGEGDEDEIPSMSVTIDEVDASRRVEV